MARKKITQLDLIKSVRKETPPPSRRIVSPRTKTKVYPSGRKSKHKGRLDKTDG